MWVVLSYNRKNRRKHTERERERETSKQPELFSFKQLLIYPSCSPNFVFSFLSCSLSPSFHLSPRPILCLRSFYSQANHMMMWICRVNAAAETDCRSSVAMKTSYEYTVSLRNIKVLPLWIYVHVPVQHYSFIRNPLTDIWYVCVFTAKYPKI